MHLNAELAIMTSCYKLKDSYFMGAGKFLAIELMQSGKTGTSWSRADHLQQLYMLRPDYLRRVNWSGWNTCSGRSPAAWHCTCLWAISSKTISHLMQKLFHIVLFIMSNQFVIMWLCSSCTQVDLSWRYNLYHETRNLNSQSKQNRRNRLKASNSRSLGYWLGILNFDDYPKSL